MNCYNTKIVPKHVVLQRVEVKYKDKTKRFSRSVKFQKVRTKRKESNDSSRRENEARRAQG